MIRLFLNSLSLALIATSVFAQPSERRALGVIFNDQHVADSVLEIYQQFELMSEEASYGFLCDWVLPSIDHDTLRMAFAFTPTHPAPPASSHSLPSRPENSRIFEGSELVCPAVALVRLAKELGKLEEVRQRVDAFPAKTEDASRARLSMLVLLDVAARDFVTANRNVDLLESLLQSRRHARFSDHWPETLVIHEGVAHPEVREGAGDLARFLLENVRYEKLNGPDAWERYIASLAYQLKPQDVPSSLDSLQASPKVASNLQHWTPVNYATARTRGQGFPLADWQVVEGEVDHSSGHHEDYLFFRVPLRGNFAVESELGGFGWRDTEMMVAGTWLAPIYDHLSFSLGNFRAQQPAVKFEPRMSGTGAWIRQRTIVKEGMATTYLNGRKMFEEKLPAEHDPWIAIRSPYYGFGGARDVRITGTPEVPRQIRISLPAHLPGWMPYFDETFGGQRGDWRFDEKSAGGGIVGSRKTELPHSGTESLLRYQRPMLEDGSIEYDFFYSAGEAQVHPALDRRAILIEPTGVRIHWITDGAYDRMKPDPFNVSEETTNRRGPILLPLISDSWNHLRLELSGDTVRLTLNHELIYECDLEPTNQRTFGLFYYSDQSEARVRNIVWEGQWPQQLPPIEEQELADHRTDVFDKRTAELTAVFEHDFVRDGLPLWRFHIYDAGWEENIELKPDGLHVRRPGGKESVRFVVSPRMHLHGDFDAIAEFEQLEARPTTDGKWGISLRSVFDDEKKTLCSVFRGLRRISGHADSQIAVGEFTQWNPKGGHDIWYPGKVAEESTSGRLRLTRRGDKVYSFVAEHDSPNFRHIHTERVTTARGRYDGIRLQTEAYSEVDGAGVASVVWKKLVVRAESITALPVPPAIEAAPGASSNLKKTD